MVIGRMEKECGRWKTTEMRCDGGGAVWGDVMEEVIRSAVMPVGWQRRAAASRGVGKGGSQYR